MACMCVFTFLTLLSLVFSFETELDSYRILKDINCLNQYNTEIDFYNKKFLTLSFKGTNS